MLLRVLILLVVVYFVYRFVQKALGGAGPKRVNDGRKPRKPDKSAYKVLGVEPGASPEEIKAAYQQLMREYHPDRVADMAEELQALAEKRTKEINAAYEQLKRS